MTEFESRSRKFMDLCTHWNVPVPRIRGALPGDRGDFVSCEEIRLNIEAAQHSTPEEHVGHVFGHYACHLYARDSDEEEGSNVLDFRTGLPLEQTRTGWISKFNVSGWDGYLVCNEYKGRPAEIFIFTAKEGSTVRGLLNALAIAISIGLRAGVDARRYAKSLLGVSFEPMGYGTLGGRQSECHSLVDAIFQILIHHYPDLKPEEEDIKMEHA
jgi:hypothetical protein